MKKAKRVVPVLVVAILSCFCLLGCNLVKKQSDENKRYDVTIRIANNFGQTWEFPPNVSELRYEFEYTGEEMRFYVDAYKLSDHPRWSEYWFEPKGEGADVFDSSFHKVNQRYDEEDPRCICEKGV